MQEFDQEKKYFWDNAKKLKEIMPSAHAIATVNILGNEEIQGIKIEKWFLYLLYQIYNEKIRALEDKKE